MDTQPGWVHACQLYDNYYYAFTNHAVYNILNTCIYTYVHAFDIWVNGVI